MADGAESIGPVVLTVYLHIIEVGAVIGEQIWLLVDLEG